MRKYFRTNPFQLDLFIRRIRLGIHALLRLRVGMSFTCPATGVEVAFRFLRSGLFFFQTPAGLFSATAEQVSMLELSR